MRNLAGTTATLAAFSLISGCGAVKSNKKSDAASTIDSSSVNAYVSRADLNPPTNLSPLTQVKMLDRLNAESDVHLSKADDTNPTRGPDATDPCQAVYDAQTYHVDGAKLILAFTADTTKCANETVAASGGGSSYKSASIHLFVQTDCGGSDLSKFDGKTVAQVRTMPDLRICQTNSMMEAVSFNYELQVAALGASSTGRNLIYRGLEDLTPCRVTPVGTKAQFSNGCLTVERSDAVLLVAGQTAPLLSFTKLTFNDVSYELRGAGRWYSGGKLAATVDDWQGSLTYSGPTTAPTYAMTSSSGQTATGTLFDAAASGGRSTNPLAGSPIVRTFDRMAMASFLAH